MRISGRGNETYLFLNGLEVKRILQLGPNVELQPASCSPSPESIIKVSRTEVDLGIASIFLRKVRSQIHVVAETPKELAIHAWNSVWDAVLLSAFCHCEVACNFQCDTSADHFGPDSQLEITNYHLRGLIPSTHTISDDEAVWLEQNFQRARNLLGKPPFLDAVHSLYSYRWHAHPRAQLAILWSGIEGLFQVESEVVFRLSLYAARFLAENDGSERAQVFADVKRLYKTRSKAVHGSKMKSDRHSGVAESADLLQRLLRQCVVCDDLPCIDKLAP